ncbi:MAG TPA: hemolysin family protein [Peptococcaceae bacterium]|nr:HlyC/CorC family transporter [Clostridia bacterium]HOB82352.1 hemolysin family protein [Peptococcaceae bacterium]HPZ71184.1 hemolysin family protein [Peptococcaceae bacterium]HQD54308.1 hemolysin family protein [Peptococcaceae bacterium]
MDPDGSKQILMFLLMLFLAGLLATWEYALKALQDGRLHQQENDERVLVIKRIFEAPKGIFETLLFGKLVLWIGATVLGTLFLMQYAYRGWVTVTLAALGLLFLFVFFAKSVPEVLGKKYAAAISLFFSNTIIAAKYLFTPFMRFFEMPGRLFGKLLGYEEAERAGNGLTEKEFIDMVASGQEDEEIAQVEKSMLHNVFEFADMVVKDVMTPRPDITALEKNTSFEDLMNVVKEEQFSRIPVYDGIIDNILGVVHIKDLIFLSPEEKVNFSPEKHVRQTIFVPETKKISELFMTMKKEKIHMAIVLDEYGGTAGLVTMEDLIEEIMGDIQDEHDSEEPLVQVLDDDLIEINAVMRIEELNDYLHTDLQFEEADTVGGLVFSLLDRVPVEGDKVEIAGLELTVWTMDGHRIEKVRIRRLKSTDDDQSPKQDDGENGNGSEEGHRDVFPGEEEQSPSGMTDARVVACLQTEPRKL